MDLTQTAEQDAIQASVRSFLDKELPMPRVREITSGGHEGYAELWLKAGALGFFGLALSESEDGAGYTLAEELVLFEELGRALAPGPWLGCVVAAHALQGATTEALVALRREILHGVRRVTLVEAASEGLAVTDEGVDGEHLHVPDAHVSDVFLVLGKETALLVEKGETVRVTPRPSLDPTRPIAQMAFRQSPGFTLPHDAPTLRRIATVLACAEAVGGIQRTVEMSVEYAKVRTQFDRPIGSFQAVKHRCADMAVRAEVARSATTYATISVRDQTADRDFQVSVAKVLCGNAYINNAADNVQNHGGMGFTWECDAHLFVKRARSFELALGSRRAHLDALVADFRAA
jgi:alkylation response protein AidB-like acyl-CoA dehydrogenase